MSIDMFDHVKSFQSLLHLHTPTSPARKGDPGHKTGSGIRSPSLLTAKTADTAPSGSVRIIRDSSILPGPAPPVCPGRKDLPRSTAVSHPFQNRRCAGSERYA
jgi:hypothetical protein